MKARAAGLTAPVAPLVAAARIGWLAILSPADLTYIYIKNDLPPFISMLRSPRRCLQNSTTARSTVTQHRLRHPFPSPDCWGENIPDGDCSAFCASLLFSSSFQF